MTFLAAELHYVPAGFVFFRKTFIFVVTITHFKMKKVVAFLLLAAFVSACSQYTCPTYSKKDVPAKKVTEKRI
jgi:peroxiredoxin